jgi:hypothetical protein
MKSEAPENGPFMPCGMPISMTILGIERRTWNSGKKGMLVELTNGDAGRDGGYKSIKEAFTYETAKDCFWLEQFLRTALGWDDKTIEQYDPDDNRWDQYLIGQPLGCVLIQEARKDDPTKQRTSVKRGSWMLAATVGQSVATPAPAPAVSKASLGIVPNVTRPPMAPPTDGLPVGENVPTSAMTPPEPDDLPFT